MRNNMRTRGRKTLIGIVAAALVSLLSLSALFATVSSPTEASWTDMERTQGEFAAETLGSVRDLTCEDSTLITLGADHVKMSWSRPANTPADLPITYEIRWEERGLSTQNGVITTTATSYTHKTNQRITNLAAWAANYPRSCSENRRYSVGRTSRKSG